MSASPAGTTERSLTAAMTSVYPVSSQKVFPISWTSRADPANQTAGEHGLGADRERASELGKQGGKASGSENEVVDEDFDPNGQDPAAGLEPAIEDAGDDSTTGTSGGGDYK